MADIGEIDELLEEARRLSRVPPRRTGQRPPASAKGASKDGRDLGRRFGHDSFALARSLGLAVERVPLGQLQREDRPGVTITGRFWCLQPPLVQLAEGLDARESARVLAHEIGHFLDLPDERSCDQFADRFVKVEDDEMPGAAARAIQAELRARAGLKGR
jgi:hypothetical protein